MYIQSADPITDEHPADAFVSEGRAKLQSWLYRTLRIQLTDGRILIGNFLCTDSEANVILGMCMEDTDDGGEKRILGLVMIPGRHIVKMEGENMGLYVNG